MESFTTPRARFLVSMLAVFCIVASQMLPDVGVAEPSSVRVGMLAVRVVLQLAAIAALVVAWRNGKQEQRERAAVEVFDEGAQPSAAVTAKPRSPLIVRLLTLPAMMALGAFAGWFAWGGWIAIPVAASWVGWRTWGFWKAGKLSASGAPFYAFALFGGASIMMMVGYVIALAMRA
jgi:hypothetical protein